MIEPFCQGHVDFVRVDLKRGMNKGFSLQGGRSQDLRVPMAGITNSDPGGKINVAFTFDIPKLRVFRLGNEN